MSKDVDKDVKYKDLKPTESKAPNRFPRIVIVIMLAEFCERFSYSGMRAFLTIYLRSKLGYSDDGATETYHIFSTLVYFFPIVGGFIADNYFGKFKTILYMMFVYAAGNLLVAVTAIPQLAIPARLCTLIGLFMITIGTGGIKPCVTAFGGDQFKLPEQERQISFYFSILYFNLCLGSLIAKTVSPILRSEVHCFGDKDCYSLAFGAPGLVILVAIVIFVSSKRKYVMKKPEGNVVVDFIRCVSLGIKNVILKRGTEKSSHWLDSTRPKYDKGFIMDIKKTLSILTLFTVLPVFWSLLDQMGSRWTLQATKMDGRFGIVTIKPDQMQVLSPIFILILIPVMQKYIYPCLERRGIMKNPLHKLTVGGILAGVAFIASAALEIYLKTTYPVLPQPNYSQLRIYNGNPCSVSLENHDLNMMYTIPRFSHFEKKDVRVDGTKNVTIKLGGSCIKPRNEILFLEENSAISFYLSEDNVFRFEETIEKSKSGFPIVRFLNTGGPNSAMTLYNDRRDEIEAYIQPGVSAQMEVFTSEYSIRFDSAVVTKGIQLESGGVYTVLIGKDGDDYKTNIIIITAANSITVAWLLPQFFIMSIAEVMFAITGNEFAFKESPESMKAVMTSVWLLTEAVGNVIIIVITRLCNNVQQETQFLIYTVLMFLSIAVFHYLSRGYRFDEEVTPKKCRSNSEVLYLQIRQAEDFLEH